MFLCDSCTNEAICKYAENYKILSRSVADKRIEDIISVSVNCTQYSPSIDKD